MRMNSPGIDNKLTMPSQRLKRPSEIAWKSCPPMFHVPQIAILAGLEIAQHTGAIPPLCMVSGEPCAQCTKPDAEMKAGRSL